MEPNPPPDRAFQAYQVNAPLQHASDLELWKSAIESGQTALKSLILINGGAAVALLAFLGNMLTKPPPTGTGQQFPTLGPWTFGPQNRLEVARAMASFVLGVFLGAAVSATRYLNAWALSVARSRESRGRQSRGWVKFGDWMNYIAIALGLASLGAFFLGGWKSFNALR